MSKTMNLKKGFVKTLVFISLIVFTLFSLSTLFACGEKTVEEPVSGLRGTYTYQTVYGQHSGDLKITSDALNAASEFKYQYLLVTAYPERLGDGQPISYSVDQRLKLSKDFTYHYDYTINLKNPQQWGGDVASVAVSMVGTFTYVENASAENKVFTVNLSNPTAGTHTVYGAQVSNASSIYNWNKHGSPDMVLDLEYLATLPDHNFDKYTCGRTVKVNNETGNKVLTDDIFFVDILQDICKYFNF